MTRLLAVAAALYALGHPGFDAWRPMAFDRSLREFHRDVNRIAHDGIRVLAAFDRSGTVRTLNDLSGQFHALLTAR
jgi:hypothetical protein